MSRFSSRVLTELRSMVASARKPVTSSVVTMLPSNFSNWPRTLVIRWRTVKPTSEWLGSMVQVPAGTWVAWVCEVSMLMRSSSISCRFNCC